ncbi:MAG TPA: UMP kinase [Patescibacteria group bacterium]
MSNNKYIISLGGSLIVPEEIDVGFLENFKKLLMARSRKGDFFVLAPGGGRTARKYAIAAKTLGNLNRNDLDWLGIFSIKLNSLLLSSVFKNQKNVKVMNMEEARPGRSSDYDSVIFAKRYKAKYIINLTNIDYVYDKNPRDHKDAKPMNNISWKDFRKIIGNKWDPGLNLPFDPVASKFAESLKLQVIVMNGNSLNNLQNFLSDKPYNGTVIG